MGDQAMATLDDADWSEESHMDECDPGAPLDMVAEVNTRRYDDFTHWAFTMAFAKAPVDVCIRGFSAGSYSGLSMCHLLWRMPHVSVRGTLGGIALPPALLSRIPVSEGERLLLYHYTSDTLCQWRPGPAALRALACKYCIVSNSEPELRGHFGNAEHSYGHWIDLALPVGEHTLWKL